MKQKTLYFVFILVFLISTFGCSTQKTNNDTALFNNIDNKDINKKKVLVLSESQNSTYPTTLGDKEFAKLVKERTNGRIEVEVVTDGKLGSEKDTIAQVRIGTIDFARVSIAPLTNFSPNMNVLSLPFLYKNSDHMWRILDGSIGDEFLNGLEKAQITGLCFYDSGARSFYNNKKEIKSVSDLKDLRIRVQESDLMKALVSSFGAVPVALDSAKVMEALGVGQIDGAENNPPTYVSTKHYSISKYYTFDEHSRIPDILIASSLAMNKLSKEDQEIIRKAAKDSSKVQRESWKKSETEFINKMKTDGCKITELDDNAKQEFKNATAPVYDKFGSEYKDLIKKIQDTN